MLNPASQFLYRLLRRPLAVIGIVLLASFVLAGLAAPLIAPYNPAAIDLGHRLEAPSAAHPAGTDELGRDTLTRLLWGARLGVQFSLSLVVLKALPVLIIGGFSSIGGAIVGGLLVGATEKLAEVYVGTVIGDGIENWFPYLLAMLFLLVRPSGLFGEAAVERV